MKAKINKNIDKNSAFLLLETIIALALFASTALAIVFALRKSANLMSDSRNYARLIRKAQSDLAITKAYIPNKWKIGSQSTETDTHGNYSKIEISQFKISNNKGENLDGLYLIEITTLNEKFELNIKQIEMINTEYNEKSNKKDSNVPASL